MSLVLVGICKGECKGEIEEEMAKTYDYLFKLLLIGDRGTGKVAIVIRFACDGWNSMIHTIGE